MGATHSSMVQCPLCPPYKVKARTESWEGKEKTNISSVMEGLSACLSSLTFICIPTVDDRIKGKRKVSFLEKEVVPSNCDSFYVDIYFWGSVLPQNLPVLRPGSWISKCCHNRQQKKRLLIFQDAAERERSCDPKFSFTVSCTLRLNLK